MKKNNLIVLTIIMLSFSLSAKADDGKGKKGIRAGFQMSNLYYDGTSLQKNLNAFYVGIFKDTKIIPMLHFGVGLEYSQAGTFEDKDNKFVMHYLSVPVNLKLKLGPFYALGGAAASFKVGEKWTIQGLEAQASTKANWIDLPLYGGIGFQIMMLNIEARYYWGTLDLYDFNLNTSKTQYLQLGLGLSF